MRKTLVAGNWKLNGDRESVAELVQGILAGIDKAGDTEVLVCPPFVYIPQVAGLVAESVVAVGAQDVATEPKGAFTGEVAGDMLTDVGCGYVIVGHSERRALYGETDSVVAAKFIAAQKAGLVPILCVGETLEERQSNVTLEVIARQVNAVVEAAGVQAMSNAVLAYEPVWAIGTGETATPEQAQEVHASIRQLIAGQDAKIGAELRILYGGSVKASNAAELFSMEDIDGGLIGGASLDASDFLGICAAGN